MRLRDIFWIIDTKNSRATITKWVEKAGLDDADELINYVESEFKDTNDQLAAAYWICKDVKVKPATIKQALYICKQKKLDPLKQNPVELVEKNPDVKPKDKAINPNAVLTDRKEDGEGNVTYAARDEDREVLRQLINTHYGIDANPWCLLQADEKGQLTNGSKTMWEYYNAYPKRVAFRDGKLLAFSAGTNENMREWWDRFDRSFPMIPYDGKRWLGRNGGTYEIRKGRVFKTEGSEYSRLDSEYSTDIEGSSVEASVNSANHTLTIDNRTYPYTEKDGKYVVKTDNRAFTLNKDLEYDGPAASYYDDGQLKVQMTYKNGKKDGVYEYYSYDGSLRKRDEYKDDKLNGLHVEYFANGQLYVKCTYKDDHKDGLSEMYKENGWPQSKFTYKNGIESGPFERYTGYGTLYQKGAYKDGKLDGICETYYEDGQLEDKITYKNGKKDGPFETYYENGHLAERYTIKDDEPDGLYEYYYEDGQLAERSTYKDGKLDGPYEEYTEDGQLREKGTYKDGKKVK